MIRAALFAAMAGAFLPFAAAAQEATGMKLEDAGFKMSAANTPGKMTKLKSFPARTFIRRTRKAMPYYIYADPDYCKCAYVGTQAAMDTYRGMSMRASGLPGYRPGIDFTKPTGANVEHEMIQDMGEDGDMPGEDDNIFDPGLLTIPLR